MNWRAPWPCWQDEITVTEEPNQDTRAAFVDALSELMEADPGVVVVFADTVTAFHAPEAFLARFHDRIFNVGIAEQNAVGVAAGLATCGLKVFFASYAGFITMRACEQVRTSVAYPGLDVKFVGANGGLMGGERDGVTHQFFEDLSIVRAMPGVAIVIPADACQTRLATLALAGFSGPAYLRVGNGKDPIVYDPPVDFVLGKIRVVCNAGDDVAIFANGFLIRRCLDASQQLHACGIGTRVIEVHTLRPLDVPGILGVLTETRSAVTVEDHSILGGLGSAVAEIIAERGAGSLRRVGLKDVFPESGEALALLDQYGMSTSDIVAAAKCALGRC
jgi:transketolase